MVAFVQGWENAFKIGYVPPIDNDTKLPLKKKRNNLFFVKLHGGWFDSFSAEWRFKK